MPRYYFHFRSGSSLFMDEVGQVFADASLARQHARQIALELARGGEQILSWRGNTPAASPHIYRSAAGGARIAGRSLP
ncbi:MAG: DUF6894 family protein [Bradyrhizobium sp.]